MIPRIQENNIRSFLFKGKAILFTGPRQVGKTTLIQQLLSSIDKPTLWLSGDDPETRAQLNNISLSRIQALIGSNEIVVVDEAQRIKNPGLGFTVGQ